MKKLFFYASLVCVSLMWSCSKEYAVPEDETPEWLGGSIYEELQNPKSLVGTFTYYTRLADDLGYAEVLSRTGSKTISLRTMRRLRHSLPATMHSGFTRMMS